jgi:peptide/nickel transport system ATP-binding protein
MTEPPLLSVRDLVVEFATPEGMVRAVDGLDLDVRAGETVGMVGESGSGKTVTMLAAVGLLPSAPRCRVSGHVAFAGRDLQAMDRGELRALRGREIGMVFQDPMTSLHPSFRIVDQVAEAMRVHDPRLSAARARHRAVDLLERVGVPHDGSGTIPTSGPAACGSGP